MKRIFCVDATVASKTQKVLQWGCVMEHVPLSVKNAAELVLWFISDSAQGPEVEMTKTFLTALKDKPHKEPGVVVRWKSRGNVTRKHRVGGSGYWV